MKRLLAASLFCALLCSCSTFQRQPKECVRGSGPHYFTSKRSQIQSDVLEAIAQSDQKALIRYASCDFLVGPTESDTAGFNHPQKVIPLLVKAVHGLKWRKRGLNYGTQYNLPAEGAPAEHELIFRKEPHRGWYWAGYATTDRAIYGPMLENAYTLGDEE